MLDQWLREATSRGLRDHGMLPVRWSATDRAVGDDEALRSALPEGRPTRLLAGELRDEFEVAVDALAERYATIPSGRLVLLGEPGAGKSVLAILLTVGLLRARTRGGKVAVLASVTGWDPVLQDLDSWLISTLAETYYNGQTAVPRELLRGDRLLPVLDGLDEIGESARKAAVGRINTAVRRSRPVVVTCRSNEYEDTIKDGSPVLSRAPVVELEPLTTDDLEAYLNSRGWPAEVSWQPVLARMRRDPRGPLALAFSTPLVVSLAELVYGRLPERPVELLDTDRFDSRHAVEDWLVSRTIPAAYRDDPGSRAHERAERAERHLRFLAKHLHTHRVRNLAWWRLADQRLSVWTGPILGVVTGLLAIVALTVLPSAGDRLSLFPANRLGFVALSGFALAVLVTVIWLTGGRRPPGRLSLRLRGSARRLGAGFRAGVAIVTIGAAPILLVIALAIGANYHWSVTGVEVFTDAVVVTAGLALLVGTVLAAQHWLEDTDGPAVPTDPDQSIRQDRQLSLVAALVGGVLAGGLLAPTLQAAFWTSGSIFGVLTRWAGWPGRAEPVVTWQNRGYEFRHTLGSALDEYVITLVVLPGVMVAILTLVSRVWPRYALVAGVQAAAGLLPWRLAPFLSDAHRRGILRRSAGVHQFRHARLQEQLAAAPGPDGASREPAFPRLPRPVRPAIAGGVLLLLTALLVNVVPRDEATNILHGTRTLSIWSGNTGAAPLAVFSPAGDRLAVRHPDDPVIRVFRTADGRLLSIIDASEPATDAYFSPDGERLVVVLSATDDDTARSGSVWNVATSRRIASFVTGPADGSERPEVAFTADGRRFWLTSGAQQPARTELWDAGTGRIAGHWAGGWWQQAGTGAVVTREGANDYVLRDAATGAVRRDLGQLLPQGNSGTPAVEVSEDGATLLAYSSARTVAYRTGTGATIADLGRVAQYDNTYLAMPGKVVVFEQHRVRIWNASGGATTPLTLPRLPAPIVDWAFDGAGESFTTLEENGSLRQWSPSGEQLHRTDAPEAAPASSIELLGDDGYYLVGDETRSVIVAADGRRLSYPEGAAGIADARGRTLVYYGNGNDADFRLFPDRPVSFRDNSFYTTLTGFLRPELLATIEDGEAVIRDAADPDRETGRIRGGLQVEEFGREHAAFARDNGEIEVRDRSGRCVVLFRGAPGPVAALELAPDEKSLASSGSDGTLRLWEIPGKPDPAGCG